MARSPGGLPRVAATLLAALLACTCSPLGGTRTRGRVLVAAQDAAAVEVKKELSIHTVFSAECTPYFDWQSLALVRSHRLVGMPGPITRLLACDEAALKTYKYVDIVPTHVHPNFARLHFADLGDDYVPYNKPGSIKHWLENANVTEDIVFFIDADMIFLSPVTPSIVGVIPGRAVSAAYEYLVGLDAPDFVQRFLPDGNGTSWPLLRKVGGWTMMYVSDMRRVAPHWLSYTEAVRTAPDGRNFWFRLGDAYVTEEHPRPWISEMYGYSFGSAAAGVDHMVDHMMMLYPTYPPHPGRAPSILHYGLEFKVGPTYAFDKHWHVTGDRLSSCPVHLFDAPPDVDAVLAVQFGVDEEGKSKAPAEEVERVRLAALTVISLNDALRDFDAATNGTRCPVCPPGCHDINDSCVEWAGRGECESNPSFMLKVCGRACRACECVPAGQNASTSQVKQDAVAVQLRGGGGTAKTIPREGDATGGNVAEQQQQTPPRRVDPEQHASGVVRRGAAEQAEAAAARGEGSPPPATLAVVSPPPGKRLYGGGEEAAHGQRMKDIGGESTDEDSALAPTMLSRLPTWTPLIAPPAFVYLLWRRIGRTSRVRRGSAPFSPGRYED